MKRFASLTSRLVLTVVVLVTLTSLVIGSATILALRQSMYSQLDADVVASLRVGEPRGDRDGDDGVQLNRPNPGGDQKELDANFARGTLVATFGQTTSGYVLGDRPGDEQALSTKALAELATVPLDGKAHAVDLAGLGRYRVAGGTTKQGSGLITGLSTHSVDETVEHLLMWELLLVTFGVALSTTIGLVVVRRQMRPLREVAETAHEVSELPLAKGDIDLTARVPDHLTDERTEVGQVGAALNRLLEHVETSLNARNRSEQQVRQFVADASHELRTPLATIAGYTELAQRRPDDQAGIQVALAKVEGESDRMTALVEDLLLLARLDAGRPLARETVDLTRMLLEAVADAQVVAPDHVWRLDLPDEVVEVTGDQIRLHQVVSNLLTNARKYTPEGATVTVSARPLDNETVLIVRDDGPGFPADLVDHAFERFARGDTARTRSGGGVGLGLALVKAIVEEHGGSVELTSSPGDTAVTIHLPRRSTTPDTTGL